MSYETNTTIFTPYIKKQFSCHEQALRQSAHTTESVSENVRQKRCHDCEKTNLLVFARNSHKQRFTADWRENKITIAKWGCVRQNMIYPKSLASIGITTCMISSGKVLSCKAMSNLMLGTSKFASKLRRHIDLPAVTMALTHPLLTISVVAVYAVWTATLAVNTLMGCLVI